MLLVQHEPAWGLVALLCLHEQRVDDPLEVKNSRFPSESGIPCPCLRFGSDFASNAIQVRYIDILLCYIANMCHVLLTLFPYLVESGIRAPVIRDHIGPQGNARGQTAMCVY